MLAVVVEDEEVSGPDLVHAEEPPLTVGEVHHASAVKEHLRVHMPVATPCTRSNTCSSRSSATAENYRGSLQISKSEPKVQ
jgi:hypothetical protein